LKRKSAPVDKLEALNYEIDLEFIPDSQEQVSLSIEYTGYRDKLDQTFQTAIVRAKRAKWLF
jgi:hypothetical protein